MKKFIKALLRRFGIIVMKRSSGIYLPEDESYRLVCELCGRQNPVIIDGGAHRGGSVTAFSALLPQAEFHCFEPDPLLVAELRARFSGHDKVNIVQLALGAEAGMAAFNINASRPTNSLLPAANGLQSDLQGLCQTVEQINVAVTTLDDYCREKHIAQVDIVKLDLQGYDYMALLGASSVLQHVSVVMVEVLFTEIYKGCRLFPDVLRLLNDRGFELFTLCGIHYGARDELLWADAIFVNKNAQMAPG